MEDRDSESGLCSYPNGLGPCDIASRTIAPLSTVTSLSWVLLRRVLISSLMSPYLFFWLPLAAVSLALIGSLGRLARP